MASLRFSFLFGFGMVCSIPLPVSLLIRRPRHAVPAFFHSGLPDNVAHDMGDINARLGQGPAVNCSDHTPADDEGLHDVLAWR